jgi:hypothetical protein
MNCRLNESAHSQQGLPHTNFLQKNNPNCRSPTNPKGEKENGDSRLKQCNNKQSSYCPNAVELEDSQEPCNKRRASNPKNEFRGTTDRTGSTPGTWAGLK